MEQPSVWCDTCRSRAELGFGTEPIAAGVLGAPFRALTIGVIGLVALGAFETLAVATAMPVVAAALNDVAGYSLAFGVPTATGIIGMVLGGRWSDSRGPAVAVRAGIASFAGGLLLCGLAPTMSILVAGRAVQGLGTGLLGVALYVVVGHCYPEPLQARMFGAFAAAWVLPALVGPAVAGLIVDQLNWRWVFLAVAVVTVPIGVPVLRRLSGSPASQRPPAGRIRLIWAMLVGLGAALLSP